MNYLDYAHQILKENPTLTVVKGELEGKIFWIKKVSPSKRTFWHALQSFLALVLRQPVIACTAIKGGQSALKNELETLKKFYESGIRVPKILASDDSVLVLSHLGQGLDRILSENDNLDFQKEILIKAMKLLSHVHKKNLVHGRPYIRDMILCDDGEIGLVDFEETPQTAMSLAQAQARDVWLFMAAVARYARRKGDKYCYDNETLMQDLLIQYKGNASVETLEELKKFSSFLAPIGNLLVRPFWWKHIGNDARRAVFANSIITRLLT